MDMVDSVDAQISEPDTFNSEMNELFGNVKQYEKEVEKDNLDVRDKYLIII